MIIIVIINRLICYSQEQWLVLETLIKVESLKTRLQRFINYYLLTINC